MPPRTWLSKIDFCAEIAAISICLSFSSHQFKLLVAFANGIENLHGIRLLGNTSCVSGLLFLEYTCFRQPLILRSIGLGLHDFG